MQFLQHAKKPSCAFLTFIILVFIIYLQSDQKPRPHITLTTHHESNSGKEPPSNQSIFKLDNRSVKPECQIWSNCSQNSSCIIKLPEFNSNFSQDSNQLFFVESFNKSSIRGRWICSLESAIRFSSYPVKVIMTSNYLNLSKPHVRKLVNTFYPREIKFFTINTEKLLAQTPIEGMLNELNYSNPNTRTHISDLMRAALLYKYGGFYLDFDTITRRNLTRFKNSIGMERYIEAPENCNMVTGIGARFLNNGVMHFEKGSKFILKYLEVVRSFYKPSMNRYEVGERTMYRAAMLFMGKKPGIPITNYFSYDLNILPTFDFLYLGEHLTRFSVFNVSYTLRDWQRILRCSSVVHLATDVSKLASVSGDPRTDIYSVLGPRLCPLSFNCLRKF